MQGQGGGDFLCVGGKGVRISCVWGFIVRI